MGSNLPQSLIGCLLLGLKRSAKWSVPRRKRGAAVLVDHPRLENTRALSGPGPVPSLNFGDSNKSSVQIAIPWFRVGVTLYRTAPSCNKTTRTPNIRGPRRVGRSRLLVIEIHLADRFVKFRIRHARTSVRIRRHPLRRQGLPPFPAEKGIPGWTRLPHPV